ncbi:WD domain-containing protein [Diplocarpon rosae]|nr:WD domain-containing protein [Diplocarpon rosae]
MSAMDGEGPSATAEQPELQPVDTSEQQEEYVSNDENSDSRMSSKTNIVRRLLRQPTAAPNPENLETNAIESQLRPSASQHTVFSAGSPIACLARSPDGSRVVIAGAKIFKLLKIEGSTITEEVDLRAVIISYAASHDPSAATPEQLNIRDVTWSYGDLDSYIITACGNGRITVYDLKRLNEGLEIGRIQDHARQVHRLKISPFRNNWVLSASQDGTVRIFDLKLPYKGRSGIMFKQWKLFKCNADAVRDIKWSPTDGMEFACCTDAGVVQKWDIKNPTAPVLKLTAHTSACFSISWHPDGQHLVSGGIDQHCHVWDLSRGDRNQKPQYTFATPAPISRVAWRPACWSATAQGKRAAQVTVAYDDSNAGRFQTANVHIWDLARISMPFKEIENWDSAPTGLVWNTRDLLWSVDREGRFIQTDVAFVPQLIERRSLSALAFSPTGDLLGFLEKRPSPRRSRSPIALPGSGPSVQHGGGTSLSVSRSDSEEDVVGSFLGPRMKKGLRRRSSGRGQSLSTTPPSSIGLADSKVMSLEHAVEVTGVYRLQQVMMMGHAPTATTVEMFEYFTNRYLLRLNKSSFPELHAEPMDVRIDTILQSFSRTAENVGFFRLAQTWKILAFSMNAVLTRRAEYHRQSRLTAKVPPAQDEQVKQTVIVARAQTDQGDDTPRGFGRPQAAHDSPLHRHGVSMINEDLESTSNVATPLARPVRDQLINETRAAMQTPMALEEDELQLPGATQPGTPSPIAVPGVRRSPDHASSSVEGYDFYGVEPFSPATDYVAPARKVPLRLDYPEQSQNPPRVQSQRHDSAESFQMFSSSGESRGSRFMGSSGSDHSPKQEDGRELRDRVSSWESDPRRDHRRYRPEIEAPTGASSSDHLNFELQNVVRETRNRPLHNPAEPPVFRLQEASAPRVLDTTPVKHRIRAEEEPISPTTPEPAASERKSEDPNIIESDFLPWPQDPEFIIPPLDPSIIIPQQIAYQCLGGCLTAAIMVLVFRPLLPAEAIDSFQAEAIMRQYHHRLMSMKLFAEAALLRNLCVPLYPSVFAPAQENVTIGFCTDCNKPLENDPLIPGSVWRCPRCMKHMDPCPICLSREIPDDIEYREGKLIEDVSTWWYCPGCGHGGHSICMQAWHADEGTINSGGCCPLEGCLHPCLPGKWREEWAEQKQAAKARELDLAVKENTRSGSRGPGTVTPIRRDAREVVQSQAVEGVRVALGVNGLERKKSVKLVAPGEEGIGWDR